jgi:hypothetical protein
MRLGPAWRRRPGPRRWPVGAAGPADRPFLLSKCVILCDNVHTVPRAADLNRLTGGLGDVTGTGLAADGRPGRRPRPARGHGCGPWMRRRHDSCLFYMTKKAAYQTGLCIKYKIRLHFVVGYIWVCTVKAIFDYFWTSVHIKVFD